VAAKKHRPVLDPTNDSREMPLSPAEGAEWRRYVRTGVPPSLRVTLKVMVWRLVDDVLAAVRAATVAELAEVIDDADDLGPVAREGIRQLREHPETMIPSENVARQLGIKLAPKKRARG